MDREDPREHQARDYNSVCRVVSSMDRRITRAVRLPTITIYAITGGAAAAPLAVRLAALPPRLQQMRDRGKHVMVGDCDWDMYTSGLHCFYSLCLCWPRQHVMLAGSEWPVVPHDTKDDVNHAIPPPTQHLMVGLNCHREVLIRDGGQQGPDIVSIQQVGDLLPVVGG